MGIFVHKKVDESKRPLQKLAQIKCNKEEIKIAIVFTSTTRIIHDIYIINIVIIISRL